MPPTLSFTRHRLTLRLRHSARLHFRHEVMLHSLLSEALGRGGLPDSVMPFACESGRVGFEAEDEYRIGFTMTGRAPEGFAQHVARALAVYGTRGFQGHNIPMLRWFSVDEPELLRTPDIDAECAALAGRQELVLQFVSPLRIELPHEDRRDPTGFYDARNFPAGHFLRLLWNRMFFLTNGRFPTREETARDLPSIPELAVDPRQLLWIDIPRIGKPSLGGVLGRLTIANPGPPWLALLVAAQYLHLGKSAGYGFGAYRILNDAPLWNDPFGPAHTALERVASHDRLTAAARHVAEATEAGGVDGVGPSELIASLETVVRNLAKGLADGSYHASPLLGVLLPKPGGKVRALAVPTLTDRSAQRATLEVIGPAVETLLEDCSYAYRKGFSRAGAAQAIEKAYADGFRWVLDADIDSFFDAVDWERLFAKIEALYPFDPLTAILREWITAPVVFGGTLITRKQGLPQGAVVSPLLANLFLDELDEELLGDGFRLIRYADDFVVLCKDVESAERARTEARDTLGRMGLSLQEEKTSVRSLDQGLSYLGYLFCRSVSVEERREKSGDDSLPEHPIVSPMSWLAQVDLSRMHQLSAAKGPKNELPQIVPLAASATLSGGDARRPLYISDTAVYLHLQNKTLAVEKEGEVTKRYPLHSLSVVVFIGRPRATLPLILELGLAGVPVFFCHRNGEIEAVHAPFAPDADVWVAQAKASQDEAMRLAFAQEIVAAKLHNYATLAVRHSLHGCDAASAEIREMERSVWNKTEVDSVRGVEGAAAAIYFRSVAETLTPEWEFDGRVKHPPGDPFNAMLSYGYTLLYHHCTAALYAAGLVPRLGIFHRQHGAWDALASDLQEEFRYLIDGMVWSLVKRREIKPTEFERSVGGCWFAPESRKRFIGAFEDRMETGFKPSGSDHAMTYREAIAMQAMRIREYVLGRSRYEAMRAHS